MADDPRGGTDHFLFKLGGSVTSFFHHGGIEQ